MGIKVSPFYDHSGKVVVIYGFHCPACKYDHGLQVREGSKPFWTFNGDLEKPTFTPSLLVFGNKSPKGAEYDFPRCHSNITDGMIFFHGDSEHDLKGQTVEIPDWDSE